jgi:abortive infection bacteriophage resistance protein
MILSDQAHVPYEDWAIFMFMEWKTLKPFKTHRQQIGILRDRGLAVDGAKALRILEKENYYGVINGYKDFFLQVDAAGQKIKPDQYKVGATFEEIYKLYSFDRDLRNVLIEYLLKFETNIKSKISYRFSEKHKDFHAYLVLTNYSRDPKKLKTVLRLISTISNTISNRGKSGPISHYLDHHDGVPLWVLVNYLTLGNMEYFYQSLTVPLQNEIAKDFAKSYNRDYKVSAHITDEMIEAVLKTATFFRNVCAHEERLFSFRIYKPSKSGNISSLLAIPNPKLNSGNLFTMVSFLKLVSPKKEHKTLVKKLRDLFQKYSTEFTSANFNDILNEMGFDINWENYFN